MKQETSSFCPKEYFRPTNAKEAVELLERYGESAWLIAGGTDLLVEKSPKVRVLIDVTGLGLSYVKSEKSGISVGAATLIADIGSSPILGKGPLRVLADAARSLGTPQIRNMATIGGNICRPSPAADMGPPLLALNGRIKIVGKDGPKEVSAEQFFVGVKQDILQTGEMVTEILIPFPRERTGTAFIKKGRVAAGDLSIVSVAAFISLDPNGKCREVRIALGAVAPVPMRVSKAEKLLEGEVPKKELLERISKQASDEIKPISDLRASAEYRGILSRVLVERALIQALRQLM
jgi:CO/xanthine dehydrogenase FAD-binding subunit